MLVDHGVSSDATNLLQISDRARFLCVVYMPEHVGIHVKVVEVPLYVDCLFVPCESCRGATACRLSFCSM